MIANRVRGERTAHWPDPLQAEAGSSSLRGGQRTVVLHVLPQDLNRGAQVYAGRLRDVLRDDDRQEHLLATLFSGPSGGARPDLSLDVGPGVLRRGVDPRAVRGLRRLIRRLGVAVVVAHGGEALKYAVPAAGGVPVVYYKVGLSSAEIQRPMHRRLHRLLSARAARVVGVSTAILDQVADIFGVPASRQALIPNGRDPDVYRPLGTGEAPADPPRLLFVGQLESGKRPGLFLDVAERLRGEDLDFDAAVAGDGPLFSSLERRAEKLGVQLLGTRTDVPELIRRSAVVVMTSAPDTEGMPGVLIEAGLSGVPVVATEAAGVADVVADGETGSVIRGEDPAAVAAAIRELLADPELRAAQGAAGRERCLDSFTVAATALLWRELVAEIASPMGAGAVAATNLGDGA